MSLVAVAAFLVHPLRARFEVVGVDAPRMLAKVVDFDLAREPIDWQAKDDLAHGPVRQQRGVLAVNHYVEAGVVTADPPLPDPAPAAVHGYVGVGHQALVEGAVSHHSTTLVCSKPAA